MGHVRAQVRSGTRSGISPSLQAWLKCLTHTRSRYQNGVSTDQYHLTVSRAQVSTHWIRVFLKLSAERLLLFKWSQAQVQIFKNAHELKSCSWAALKKFWFQTELGRENSTGFYMLLTFLTIVTRWSCSKSNFYALIGQNLTGEFTGKIYAASGNLFTDSWNWQSFVSSWDVFNCLFLLYVQNEIQLLPRFFCNSWLVCLLHFWLRNSPLVKVIGNPISDGIVFKNELTYLPLFEAQEGWKVSSDSGLTWWPSGAASRLSCRLVSLSNYCLWCFFFPISWCRAYFMRLVYARDNDLTYNSIKCL